MVSVVWCHSMKRVWHSHMGVHAAAMLSCFGEVNRTAEFLEVVTALIGDSRANQVRWKSD